jgi:DNA-binding XRE family transcriptional regulator
MQPIQRNLRLLRAATDTKQTTIADYVGISQSTYTRIENGRLSPCNKIRQKFAEYFGISSKSLEKDLSQTLFDNIEV